MSPKDRIKTLSFALSIAGPAASNASAVTFVIVALVADVRAAAIMAAISWPFTLSVVVCIVYVLLYAAGATNRRGIEYRIGGRKQ